MGNTDRILRIVLAIIMSALVYTGTVTGIIATILLVLSAVFVLTSLIKFCPLYTIFGLKTCKN